MLPPLAVSRSSRRIAARHSSTSPTHSNGLSPPVAVSSAKPSYWSGSSSRSLPKICVSCSGVSERREDQEHEAALVAVAAPGAEPLARVELEDAVAARERPGGTARASRTPGRSLSSEAGRRIEKICGAPSISATASASSRSARRLLRELVVDLDPVPDEVAGRGAALVGHQHRVDALGRGRQQRHAADDRGDRDMAVERAAGVELEQARVDLCA